MCQNVELLRKFIAISNRSEVFDQRDIEDSLKLLHPGYELHPALTMPGETGRFVGHEGAVEFLMQQWEVWETMTVESKEMTETQDGRVLSINHWHVRGRDGIEIDFQTFDLVAFRDGLIARVDGYSDRAEALEAAGLRE